MACHSKSNHVIAQATKLRDCIIVKAMQFFFSWTDKSNDFHQFYSTWCAINF